MGEFSFTARYDRYHDAKQIVAAALNAVEQVARHLQRSLGLGRNGNGVMADLVELGVVEAGLGARLARHLKLLGTLSKAHFDEDRDILYHFIVGDRADLALFARGVTSWLDEHARDA